MKFRIGTQINCRINPDQTVIFDVDVDNELYKAIPFKPFLIIGIAPKYGSYIIKVPLTLEDSICWFVQENHLKKYSIDEKYLGKLAMMIRESSVYGCYDDPYADMSSCKICREFFPYVKENNFACWVCRTDPRNQHKL